MSRPISPPIWGNRISGSFPRSPSTWALVSVVTVLSLAQADLATAGGKLGLYGLFMEPDGQDAEEFSRAGYGGGIHVVFPLPQVHNLVAFVAGIETVNLLNDTVEYYDPQTLLRVEQQTSQDYTRLYAGPQIGPHGRGFLRPHAGVDVAAVLYGISTDIVVPDDYNREQEIRQNLRSKHRTVFGYDLTLGVDLNFWNRVSLDTGVRYLRSFGLPQQLGEGSVTIHPHYFQGYLGVGVAFGLLRQTAED